MVSNRLCRLLIQTEQGHLTRITIEFLGETFTEDNSILTFSAIFDSGELAGIFYIPSPFLGEFPPSLTGFSINQILVTAVNAGIPQQAIANYGALVPFLAPAPLFGTFTVPNGPLAGEEGSFSFTYDDSQIPFNGVVNLPLESFEFNLAGETLTLADDADGATVQFENGEFNGLNYATTSVPASENFVSLAFEVGAEGPDFGSFALLDNNFSLLDVDYDIGYPDVLPPQVLDIGLFDADSDTLIAALEDGSKINASLIAGRNLTIAATTPEESPLFGEVGSVFLDLNNGQQVQRENAVPYALFGDNNNGNLFGGNLNLPTGDNTLTLEVFSDRNLQGDLLDTLSIDFTIIDDVDLTGAVTVGLFDADTDTLIETIEEGDQIQISSEQNLTISAVVPDTSPLFGQVESVFLDLNEGAGNPSRKR